MTFGTRHTFQLSCMAVAKLLSTVRTVGIPALFECQLQFCQSKYCLRGIKINRYSVELTNEIKWFS